MLLLLNSDRYFVSQDCLLLNSSTSSGSCKGNPGIFELFGNEWKISIFFLFNCFLSWFKKIRESEQIHFMTAWTFKNQGTNFHKLKFTETVGLLSVSITSQIFHNGSICIKFFAALKMSEFRFSTNYLSN